MSFNFNTGSPGAPDQGYYDGRLAKFGPTARGAGWNSDLAQKLRFRELIRIFDDVDERVSLIDYGCGYGALLDYLKRGGREVTYTGYDVSAAMIETAQELYRGNSGARFTSVETDLEPAEFVVASGLFGKPFEVAESTWEEYVLATIDRLAAVSTRGFAFNLLTSYSDPNRMREDLYYANPGFLFDHCMTSYGGRVSLLHGYDLYDFTLHVLLEPRNPPRSEGSG